MPSRREGHPARIEPFRAPRPIRATATARPSRTEAPFPQPLSLPNPTPRARPLCGATRAGRFRPEPAAAERRGRGQAAASAPPAARRGGAPEAAVGIEASPRRLPVPSLTTAEPQLRPLHRHRQLSTPPPIPAPPPARRLPGPGRPCGTARSSARRLPPCRRRPGADPSRVPALPWRRRRAGGLSSRSAPFLRSWAERGGQPRARCPTRPPHGPRPPVSRSARAAPCHRTPALRIPSVRRIGAPTPRCRTATRRLSPSTAYGSAAPPTADSQWGPRGTRDV